MRLTCIEHDVLTAWVINWAALQECVLRRANRRARRCPGKQKCGSCAARVLMREADRYFKDKRKRVKRESKKERVRQ